MTDLLDAAGVNRAVQGTIFADRVQIFPTIDSTNSYALHAAQKGAPHGSVYVAEEQTAGRGRGAHAWHSERGAGLYLSVVTRPQRTPGDALWLSLAAGLAVQAAVEAVTELVADIRWPNDLLLGDRKFGGILTEMNGDIERVRYAVTGIGMNVNHRQFPPDLRAVATSLRLESGQDISRQGLLIATLEAMHSEIGALMHSFAEATDGILKRIEERSTWIRGKSVAVDEAGGYTGVTAGLDAHGFLRVATEAGIRTVLSGGVRSTPTKG